MSQRKLKPTKELIKQGLLMGVFYASLMALFYYFGEDEPFSLLKFLFNMVFFGGFMTFALRFDYRDKKK